MLPKVCGHVNISSTCIPWACCPQMMGTDQPQFSRFLVFQKLFGTWLEDLLPFSHIIEVRNWFWVCNCPACSSSSSQRCWIGVEVRGSVEENFCSVMNNKVFTWNNKLAFLLWINIHTCGIFEYPSAHMTGTVPKCPGVSRWYIIIFMQDQTCR